MPSWSYPPSAGGGGGGGGGGGSCEIDVAEFPGADLGAKLQAAIDSLPATGGVLTCECLTGAQAITATVNVNKPVKIKFGASVIACSASPSLYLEFLGDDGPGANIEGAGIGVTQFQAAAGVGPAILVECDNAVLRNFELSFAGANAANIGILCHQGPTFFGRVRTHLENLLVQGAGQTGSGMQFDVIFGIEVIGCEIRQFNYGVHTIPNVGLIGSVTAMVMIQNRVFLCNTGLFLENTSDLTLVGNTIEGNANYGIHGTTYCFNLQSFGNHYEQIAPAINIRLEGAGDIFHRDHTFSGDFFSGPPALGGDISVGLGGTINVTVYGGVMLSGVTFNNALGVMTLNEVDSIGTNSGTRIIVYYQGTDTGFATQHRDFTGWLDARFFQTVEVNPFQVTTVDFLYRSGVDPFTLVASGSLGTVGVGTLFNATIKLNVGYSPTGIAGAIRGVNILYDADPTANTTADNAALVSQGQSKSGNIRNFSFIRGAVLAGVHNGSGTAAAVRGAEVAAINAGPGNVTNMTGVEVDLVNSGAGTTANGQGVNIGAPVVSAGVMTSFISLQIIKPTAATFNASINVTGGDCVFNQTKTGGDFIVFGNGDSFPGDVSFMVAAATGRVNVGGATPTLGKFQVTEFITAIDTARIANYTAVTVSPTAASAGSYTGVHSDVVAGGGFNITGGVIAMNGASYWTSTHTLTSLWGGQFQVFNLSSGTVVDAEAIRCRVRNEGSGTIQSGSGIVIDTPINSGGGAISAQIQLLIFESTVAGANWSIYTSGGLVEFNANNAATGDFWIRGVNTNFAVYFDADANTQGYLGLGTNGPETRLHSLEAWTLTGDVADAYSATITSEPGYGGNFTVDRHNYFNVKNIVTIAGAPVITDACVFRFNAAPGVHKAIDGATTKTTPGGVDAWMKHNVDGTVYYSPLYLSKTA